MRQMLGRHPRWTVAIAVVLALVLVGVTDGEDAARDQQQDSASAEATDAADPKRGASDRGDGSGRKRAGQREPGRRRATKPVPQEEPTPPAGRSAVVARVVDGDTLELDSAETVRLVGVDTPERGECGYQRATDYLARIVQGSRVRLTRSEEDRDRYDRLLRYVDVGSTDAGLRLIKAGLADARYDSRDGYGFHRREPAYVRADRRNRDIACAAGPLPEPQPGSGQQPGCEPGYDPCVPSYPPDLDCADVDGPLRVTGPDPHGLDAEGDGRACEWG